MSTDPIPDHIGDYRIVRRLAYGGMAEVLLAEQGGADGFTKKVVIKRILPQYSQSAEFVRMFRAEARMMSRLHHGNIVQILGFGHADERQYLVLEFVDGPSLYSAIRGLTSERRRLALAEIAHIGSEVARGLDYVHRKLGDDGRPLQMVHRDVSPSNVLLSWEGEVKLADFGIARASASVGPSSSRLLKGKIGYLAPETLRDGQVDARSDLFALGAVLFEMLTGHRAFSGETEGHVIERVLAGAFARPRDLNSTVPPDVDQLVLELLDPDPQRRPKRASEVVDRLATLLRDIAGTGAARLAQTLRDLPRQPTEQAPERPTTVRPENAHRQLLLVIDQSRTVRARIRAALVADYEVIESGSLEQAVELIQDSRPRAVLCQRTLPRASGLSLCKVLREDPRFADTIFLLLASDVTDDLREQASVAGADGVLPKHVSADDLKAALKRARARRRESD